MTIEQLHTELNKLQSLTTETEVVEFKEAKFSIKIDNIRQRLSSTLFQSQIKFNKLCNTKTISCISIQSNDSLVPSILCILIIRFIFGIFYLKNLLTMNILYTFSQAFQFSVFNAFFSVSVFVSGIPILCIDIFFHHKIN